MLFKVTLSFLYSPCFPPAPQLCTSESPNSSFNLIQFTHCLFPQLLSRLLLIQPKPPQTPITNVCLWLLKRHVPELAGFLSRVVEGERRRDWDREKAGENQIPLLPLECPARLCSKRIATAVISFTLAALTWMKYFVMFEHSISSSGQYYEL